MHGDPVVINILRYGEALIDYGGFFNPLKSLFFSGGEANVIDYEKGLFQQIRGTEVRFQKNGAEVNLHKDRATKMRDDFFALYQRGPN